VAALLAFPEPERTADGVSPADALGMLARAGIQAYGVNCGRGPEDALAVARAFTEGAGSATARKLVLLPSAGLPARDAAGALRYPEPPPAFTAFGRKAAALGVGAVGGCCGTGPEHIRALARGLATNQAPPRPGPDGG